VLGLWAICFVVTMVLAAAGFTFAAVLARQGLPLKPVMVGILCGLGTGLAGEAVWRMHCSITAFHHVLAAHTGAVLAMAVAGAFLGSAWARKSAIE
jgi:hypothetical protein